MRANLMFERFCQICQDALLMYFRRKFTRYFEFYFLVRKNMHNPIKVKDCFFDVAAYCLMKN